MGNFLIIEAPHKTIDIDPESLPDPFGHKFIHAARNPKLVDLPHSSSWENRQIFRATKAQVPSEANKALFLAVNRNANLHYKGNWVQTATPAGTRDLMNKT
jgi:hypothetical protein